eukprot:11937396-Alexandrium_andersonii.AAC.1
MHAAALGMRNPCERTMQAVTALYLLVAEGEAARRMPESAKLTNLQHVKHAFKRMKLLEPSQLPQKLPSDAG